MMTLASGDFQCVNVAMNRTIECPLFGHQKVRLTTTKAKLATKQIDAAHTIDYPALLGKMSDKAMYIRQPVAMLLPTSAQGRGSTHRGPAGVPKNDMVGTKRRSSYFVR